MTNNDFRIMAAQQKLDHSIEAVAFWAGHPVNLKAAKKAMKRNRRALAKLAKAAR